MAIQCECGLGFLTPMVFRGDADKSPHQPAAVCVLCGCHWGVKDKRVIEEFR